MGKIRSHAPVQVPQVFKIFLSLSTFICRGCGRKTIPAEEQEKIFAEVHSQLQQQDLKRKVRRRRGAISDQ